MLTWLTKDVPSPYGPVATLHWAVPDDDHTDDTDGAGEALQEALESAEDQLGAVLWNSNTAALQHLHERVFSQQRQQGPRPLAGLCVLELGAGVGCLGIALALGGARVCVTDLKELLPLMQYNVEINAARLRAANGSGEAACTAQTWKWGPSVSLHPLKQLQKQQRGGKAKGGTDTGTALAAATAATLEALAQPSEAWAACRRTALQTDAVDYVLLCDALYGNPKDWPQLLYTLSEVLEAHPQGCEVVNFCEQRVHDVEGAFLALLREENAKPAYAPGDEATVVAEVVALYNEGGRSASETSQAVASRLLDLALRRKRGAHVWDIQTEVMSGASSELDMVIRVTRLRWVKAGDAAPTGERQRRREAEKEEGAGSGPKQKRQRLDK